MKNSAYLKKYVENHPNNKMAWYLLGKEYEESGQEGKAHYCYIQAGSVYEAFESSKIPDDLWMGYEAGILQETRREEKRSRLIRKVGLLLLVLLFMWLPSAQAPGLLATTPVGTDSEHPESSPVDSEPSLKDDEERLAAADPAPREEGTRFTAIGYPRTDQQGGSELGGLLRGNETGGQFEAVLGMERQGKWLSWSHRMPVVYGIQSLGNGRTAVQSYDLEACLCTPPDSARLQKEAVSWISKQESLAVLSSAMIRYKEKHGRWPAALQELTKPFPDNWLAGSNEHMREAFDPLLLMLQERGSLRQDDRSMAQGEASDGIERGIRPFFTEPLEVIVDTSNYRLAVVSGSVILRSYQVGLGGSKTPQGTFHISDKVVNPNGKSDGEFGSRGMQLSDTNYAIHGTNEPDSIGKDESLGCIRMGKKDVEELFDLLPMGTKVTIGKGGLPHQDLIPAKRFTLRKRQDQSNPHRTYRWLR